MRTASDHPLEYHFNPPNSLLSSLTPTTMLFTRLLALAAIGLTTANGFLVPEGQEEGIYSVEIINGVSVHIKIGNSTEVDSSYLDTLPTARKRTRLQKRWDVTCAGGTERSHTFVDGANWDLDWLCRNMPSIKRGQNLYAVRGTIVSYFCVLDAGSAVCDIHERSAMLAKISDRCGIYKAGYFTQNDNAFIHGWGDVGCFCDTCS